MRWSFGQAFTGGQLRDLRHERPRPAVPPWDSGLCGAHPPDRGNRLRLWNLRPPGGGRGRAHPVGEPHPGAAPHGTGHIKAGLNYAMSLHAIVTAHKNGFDENMYLDSATRTKVEETGGANFLFVTKDNKIVTPHSTTILPSITRRSLMYVAEHYLGLEVEERDVYFDEVKDFAECGLCGTAAVISPVGKVVNHGEEICFPSGMEKMGPTIQKLYDTLTGIQMGHIEAPEGWIKVIE